MREGEGRREKKGGKRIDMKKGDGVIEVGTEVKGETEK